MKQTVNYIKHLETCFDKISMDNRLSPYHVSLYYSLFHQWNLNKFRNPISICRSELMMVSKIGSANTYTKCLKQLNEWGYIQYLPSFNPARGSLVNLYNFDKGGKKGSSNSSNTANDKVVRPSLNSLNNSKLTKPIKQESKSRFTPPTQEEVKEIFLELKSSQLEAENFFNHFESNGWLVGGKAKMKNWKAAAKNWISRSLKFSNTSVGRKNSDVNENKDYTTPL